MTVSLRLGTRTTRPSRRKHTVSSTIGGAAATLTLTKYQSISSVQSGMKKVRKKEKEEELEEEDYL